MHGGSLVRRSLSRLNSGKDFELAPKRQVTYRHVELTCGGHVLVEADNWYVPSRVGPDINHVLTTTDTPFGRAVQELKPVRENLSVEILWSPLPDGWELAPPPSGEPGEALAMPWQLFVSIAPSFIMTSMSLFQKSERFLRAKS